MKLERYHVVDSSHTSEHLEDALVVFLRDASAPQGTSHPLRTHHSPPLLHDGGRHIHGGGAVISAVLSTLGRIPCVARPFREKSCAGCTRAASSISHR